MTELRRLHRMTLVVISLGRVTCDWARNHHTFSGSLQPVLGSPEVSSTAADKETSHPQVAFANESHVKAGVGDPGEKMGRGHQAGHSGERDCQSTWAAMIST